MKKKWSYFLIVILYFVVFFGVNFEDENGPNYMIGGLFTLITLIAYRVSQRSWKTYLCYAGFCALSLAAILIKNASPANWISLSTFYGCVELLRTTIRLNKNEDSHDKGESAGMMDANKTDAVEKS
ncbi:MAG: hypothetical protein SOW48_05115 [Peptoniphilaceae bacterium]|nr:hypothetical protein [Peptoniphilaceae bacterium]MCI6660404.1 hypothetical protein [Peptoniphilaceae bacterium]MDD7433357.1 hypothetical protein [Peptoniphilaceae bacterium]MDY3076008.1 hypothetical protein [Peptoniphilaceae bacterium]MDY3986540.1 hypothetical protein [Peptoniphilaceae bacterium]